MADGGGGEALMGEPVAGETVFAPDVRETILARIAAGESLRGVCRAADMPSRKTVRAWANGAPAFAQALADAMRQARTVRRLADRRALAAWKARPRKRPAPVGLQYTLEIGEAICGRLCAGESLSSIARDPDMPTYETIMKWVRRLPAFEDMYVQARQVQADYLFDEARDVAKAATPDGVWVSRLQFDVIRWQTARMAPRKYCERLAVDIERAAVAQAARQPMQILHVDFSMGPNGKVLVAPPRCEEEEQHWVEAHGKPYDGPR